MPTIFDGQTVHELGMGAALLSVGGGGFPYYEYLSALELLEHHAPVELIDVASLPEDTPIALVAGVGAPLAMLERIVDAEQFVRAVRTLSAHLGVEFRAVMSYEIGSINAIISVLVATRLGLPVVDADTLGRSFPEVQMSSLAIAGSTLAPVAVSDIRDTDLVITRSASAQWTETTLRHLAGAFGLMIAICGMHRAAEIRQSTVLGSYSRAIGLGRAMLACRAAHRDPVEMLVTEEGGTLIARGKVVDVERETTDAFVRGTVRIEPHGGGPMLVVDFQNEYLLARAGERRLAVVPDLIALIDLDHGEPLGAEVLRYGQQLAVVSFPAIPEHRSAAALAAVGPRAFGYDFDHPEAATWLDA